MFNKMTFRCITLFLISKIARKFDKELIDQHIAAAFANASISFSKHKPFKNGKNAPAFVQTGLQI